MNAKKKKWCLKKGRLHTPQWTQNLKHNPEIVLWYNYECTHCHKVLDNWYEYVVSWARCLSMEEYVKPTLGSSEPLKKRITDDGPQEA
jgi:hypothetical protein